jgi:hypothetical protein
MDLSALALLIHFSALYYPPELCTAPLCPPIEMINLGRRRREAVREKDVDKKNKATISLVKAPHMFC